MEYKIEFDQSMGHRQIAVVRRQGTIADLPKIVPQACGIVWGTMKAQNIKGAGRQVIVLLDDVINFEIGCELSNPFDGHGEVIVSSLPAGPVVKTVHFGPYEKLREAHPAIHAWCKSHNHALSGPKWEIYGHWEPDWKDNPEKICTEVFYLLEKAV